MKLVEVPKDTFYKAIVSQDVVVRTTQEGSDFELRDRTLIGRALGCEGHYYDSDAVYFLVDRGVQE